MANTFLNKDGLYHLVSKLKTYIASQISAHTSNKSNPHGVTKSQVGLGSVANIDQSKAIKTITRSGTTFTATALDGTQTTFDQQDSNTTYGVATSSANGLMSAGDKAKLDGIAAGANKYTHPAYTAKSSGLYKVTVDGTGHVSTATAVTKADITALGIPGQDTNTTYTGADVSKLLFLGTHSEAAAGGANNPKTGMATGDNGLYLTASYQDSVTPTNFGNIINAAGSGTGQLFLGWSGADNYTEHIWYRSHRDTSTGGWGNWRKVVYADEVTTTVKNFTLSASGWFYDGSRGMTFQNINDSLITETSIQEVIPNMDISSDQMKALQKANIIGYNQVAGTLSLRLMGTQPTIDIPITVIFRGTI